MYIVRFVAETKSGPQRKLKVYDRETQITSELFKQTEKQDIGESVENFCRA